MWLTSEWGWFVYAKPVLAAIKIAYDWKIVEFEKLIKTGNRLCIFFPPALCAPFSKRDFSSCCVHENIFDIHLCRGKLNSQTIIDWRCRNMFNPPITDRKALPQKKITSWRFAIEIFVTFAFWDFRNFWLCSPLQRAKMSPRRRGVSDRKEMNAIEKCSECETPKKKFLIQLSFQSVSNDSEEIHHESVENIIVDDSADTKPFFHDPAGFVSNVNWTEKTAENCLKVRIKNFPMQPQRNIKFMLPDFCSPGKKRKKKKPWKLNSFSLMEKCFSYHSKCFYFSHGIDITNWII